MRGYWSKYTKDSHYHSCEKLDNALRLGFPSAVIVKNVRTVLEFTVRHDSRIDNQEIITKHE